MWSRLNLDITRTKLNSAEVIYNKQTDIFSRTQRSLFDKLCGINKPCSFDELLCKGGFCDHLRIYQPFADCLNGEEPDDLSVLMVKVLMVKVS
jgi:predicted nucleic acid binding AN1-type Zn finger protein